MTNTIYLEEGELVDTYGGDYTYMDKWAEYEDGEWLFYCSYYGAKAEPTFRIDDPTEVKELLEELKRHKDYHE